MTRSEKQRQSLRVVSELLGHVSDKWGYELAFGELARTKESQALYLTDGKAQTMHSTYMNRLAVEFNLVIDGHDQLSVEVYKPLADDWVRLDREHHVWGGHGTTLWDAVHLVYGGEERAMRDEAGNTMDAIGETLNKLVRPLLAIMFGGAIVYMAIFGAITSGEFLGIGAVVVGFFFQARQAEKAQERVNAQQDQLVELAKAVPPEKLPEQQPRIVNG